MKLAPRIRRSAREWHQLVREQTDSGVTIATFCRQRGIVYQSFMNWRRRVRDRPLDTRVDHRTDTDALPAFIELTASGVERPDHIGSPWLVELDLGDGLQLRIGRRD